MKEMKIGNERGKKLEELEQITESLKALTHPVRIRILQELKTGKKCVGELAERIGVAQANLSQHLNLLRNYGWINREKKALYVYYSLSDKNISPVLRRILEIVDKFFK